MLGSGVDQVGLILPNYLDPGKSQYGIFHAHHNLFWIGVK
jgi:hypothetical protein